MEKNQTVISVDTTFAVIALVGVGALAGIYVSNRINRLIRKNNQTNAS